MFNRKLKDQVNDINRILSRDILFLRHDHAILCAQYVNLTKKHDNLQKQMDLLLEHLGAHIENTPAKTEIVRNV